MIEIATAGSRCKLRKATEVGSLKKARCSPSTPIHTAEDCGVPSAIVVATWAKFGAAARSFTSWSSDSPTAAGSLGVDDRIRTGDRLDHNQELYQLSYVHRVGPI